MILPDKRPVERDFANLTDYSQKCPDGARKFFAFIHFTDESTCLWSNIFTFSRTFATMLSRRRVDIYPPPFYKSLQISDLCSRSDLWRIASELTRTENFSTRVPVACVPEYRTIAYEVFYIYDSKFIKIDVMK